MDAEIVRNMQSNIAVTNKRYCQSCILLVLYIIQSYDARKLKHKMHNKHFIQEHILQCVPQTVFFSCVMQQLLDTMNAVKLLARYKCRSVNSCDRSPRLYNFLSIFAASRIQFLLPATYFSDCISHHQEIHNINVEKDNRNKIHLKWRFF